MSDLEGARMKLEPVAWVDQEKISALYDKRVSGIGAVLHKCNGSPGHKPLYAIPEGYKVVPVEPKDEDLFRSWVKVANGTIDDIDRFQAAYKAMIEGEQC